MPVPIIGAPTIAASGALITFTIKCSSPCEREHLFCGVPGVAVGCASCRKVYVLMGWPQQTEQGLGIPVRVSTMPEDM
jgi:hypothetical protein